jgi:hypothetical protein
MVKRLFYISPVPVVWQHIISQTIAFATANNRAVSQISGLVWNSHSLLCSAEHSTDPEENTSVFKFA